MSSLRIEWLSQISHSKCEFLLLAFRRYVEVTGKQVIRRFNKFSTSIFLKDSYSFLLQCSHYCLFFLVKYMGIAFVQMLAQK